jgi:predicted TIM-barrel fold metal-dependent hydrolase
MSRPVPTGAWDCHAHVFGDPGLHPPSPGADYDPPPAPLAAYLRMLDDHGLARGVLVQPSVYGFDNRCLLDALDRAEGRLLGVAVPPPDASTGELEAMHRRGVRGIRCNLLNSGGLAPAVAVDWQPILASLGWHVALQVDIGTIADLRAYVERFSVPVVIDHMGRPRPGHADPAAPGPRQLVELVGEGACFTKLSAPYRLSAAPPPWPDVAPLARALLDANPAACLWASDWPHAHVETPVRAADVFQALDDGCPPGEVREIVMVRTPRALFGEE